MRTRGNVSGQFSRGRPCRRKRRSLLIALRRAALLLVLALLALHAPQITSHAGEFPEHWHLVNFVARVAGYSQEDAALIADASWAVDQNEDTLATGHWSDFLRHVNNTAGGASDPEVLNRAVFDAGARTMAQGSLLHALSKNRASAAQLYESYIKEVGDAATTRPDEKTRKLRLVLFGMYLHYVVDSFVHPDEAIPGHLFEEHQTDRIPNQPLEFTKAAAKSYRLLLEHQSFLAPDGLAERGRLRGRYNLDVEMGQEGFFGNAVKAIAEAYADTQRSSADRRLLERGGALGYPTQGLPPADLRAVSLNLDLLWTRRVMPDLLGSTTGYDIFLGNQRQPFNTEKPPFITYQINPASGELTIESPAHEQKWDVPSFIQFVRKDRDDGLNGLREEMRAELVSQLQRTLRVAQAGKGAQARAQSAVTNNAPARAAERMTEAVLNIIVSGSGSSAEKVSRSSWSPDAGSVSPQFEPRKVVIEVARRGWATDGLEKYLRPAPPKEPANETRIRVDEVAALARTEVRQQLERAVTESPRVTVIFEDQRRTPGTAEQSEEMAKVIEGIARKQAEAHPEATRTLYVEGSGADVLRPVLRREQEGVPEILRAPVVVQPMVSPSDLPRDSTVVLTRSPFMNFDPGSPGYQRLKASVRDYGRVASGVAVVESGDLNPPAQAGAPQARGKPPLEYYPKGSTDSTEPIRLSNSRPADVLAPTRSTGRESSQQIVRQILQTENEHKPSAVGGISLVTPATLPVDGRSVTGATYDQSSRRIVLRSKDNRRWQLPPTDPELTRIAFECLYLHRVAPELSIGVNPNPDAVNPNVSVYYLSAVQGTRLGHIMFESDKLLGRLAFGGSEVLRELGLSSLNLHTLPELYPDRYAESPGSKYSYGEGRVYLVPSRITLVEQGAGELRFDETHFDVRFEPSGPAEQEFVSSLVSNWEKILAAPAAEPFRELAEAARVVSIFNWLREYDIPFDDSLAGIVPRQVLTPTDFPPERAPARESLNPTLPLTRYGVNGIEGVYDRDGKLTRLAYRNGRIAAVERKDGATLNVYADDVDNLAAVAVSGSDLGAVFDTRAGRARFLDQVKLRFADGKYVGFDTTPRTRALYDVNPEDIVSTIVTSFIAEAHSPNDAAGQGQRRMNGPRVGLIVGVAAAFLSGGFLLYLWARKKKVQRT